MRLFRSSYAESKVAVARESVPVVCLQAQQRFPSDRAGVVTIENLAVAEAAFWELSTGRPSSFTIDNFAKRREWVRMRVFRACGGLCSTRESTEFSQHFLHEHKWIFQMISWQFLGAAMGLAQRGRGGGIGA